MGVTADTLRDFALFIGLEQTSMNWRPAFDLLLGGWTHVRPSTTAPGGAQWR